METIQMIFSILGFYWELIEWFFPAFAIVGVLAFFFFRHARKCARESKQAEMDYLAKKIAEEMKKEE